LLESAAAPLRSPATLAKAIVFGFGAAVVGAIIYYAVMRYLNLEIGLVAILTGWMVGKAMSKATAARGGRLLQVSAALLTYVSVAMAYVPFAMQGLNSMSEQAASAPADSASASTDSVGAAQAPSTGLGEASTAGFSFVGLMLGVVILAGFALAVPIIAILGSMPGGLISAAIIGFGMLQAWQLTGAPKLVFEGPFRLAPKDGAGDGA
jgi:hypothetical protein